MRRPPLSPNTHRAPSTPTSGFMPCVCALYHVHPLLLRAPSARAPSCLRPPCRCCAQRHYRLSTPYSVLRNTPYLHVPYVYYITAATAAAAAPQSRACPAVRLAATALNSATSPGGVCVLPAVANQKWPMVCDPSTRGERLSTTRHLVQVGRWVLG